MTTDKESVNPLVSNGIDDEYGRFGRRAVASTYTGSMVEVTFDSALLGDRKLTGEVVVVAVPVLPQGRDAGLLVLRCPNGLEHDDVAIQLDHIKAITRLEEGQ